MKDLSNNVGEEGVTTNLKAKLYDLFDFLILHWGNWDPLGPKMGPL